jgi:hypothetical protein
MDHITKPAKASFRCTAEKPWVVCLPQSNRQKYPSAYELNCGAWSPSCKRLPHDRLVVSIASKARGHEPHAPAQVETFVLSISSGHDFFLQHLNLSSRIVVDRDHHGSFREFLLQIECTKYHGGHDLDAPNLTEFA